MKSKVTFDLDGQNRPIILAQVSPSDDVRDKIATRFKEGFQNYSNIAMVSFWPDEWKDGAPLNTIQILPLPNVEDPKEHFTFLSTEQIRSLSIAFDVELGRRDMPSAPLNENMAYLEAAVNKANPEKSILARQAAHSLADCFKELKWGRPAAAQEFLDQCIAEAEKRFSVEAYITGKSSPASDSFSKSFIKE